MVMMIIFAVLTPAIFIGPEEVSVISQPVFIVEPTNRTAVVGEITSFTAEAIGGIVSYQWIKSIDNGETWIVLEGETNQSLFFPSVKLTDAGMYACIAKNSDCPGRVSEPAVLTVLSEPFPPAQMSLYHATGSHEISLIFNANQNPLENIVVFRGILPPGSTWQEVTALILEFKSNSTPRFIEVPVEGLPSNGESSPLIFNGSNATDGEDPAPFDLLGWQGQIQLLVRVIGAIAPIPLNSQTVNGFLNEELLTVVDNYYICPPIYP